MKNTVHVWVCHGSHELGVLRTKLIVGDGLVRELGERWRILLEDLILLPLLLVFLLACNEGIALVGLGTFSHMSLLSDQSRMLTFSIFKVFFELLLGSSASLVTCTAAMVALRI